MAIILYLIYLFSGILKAVLIFYDYKLPIDITLFTGFLLLLYIVYNSFVNGVKLKIQTNIATASLILFLFFIWMLISLIYGASTNYGYFKAVLFLTNIIAFLFPLLINKFDLLRFLRLFSVFIILSFVWFYYVYFILIKNLKGTELYYQVAGLSLTLAIYGGIILLVLITSRKRIFDKTFYNISAISLTVFFLILSGARGPIFFVIISLFLFYMSKIPRISISRKININRILKYVLFILPFFLSVIFVGIYKYYDKISVLLERSIYRISLIVNGIESGKDMGDSVNVRINQIEFAVKSIFDNFKNFLIGYGFGSFGIMYSGEDGRLYPHNILLEIWFELGFLGLFIFSAFLIYIFFGKIKQRTYISGLVLLYIFLNMLKSNSIVDIRVFFAFFALFIINFNIYINET